MSVLDLYYADQISEEDALDQLDKIWIENTEQHILDNPEWNSDPFRMPEQVERDL